MTGPTRRAKVRGPDQCCLQLYLIRDVSSSSQDVNHILKHCRSAVNVSWKSCLEHISFVWHWVTFFPCVFIISQAVEAAGLQWRGASCLPGLMSSVSTHHAKTVCLRERDCVHFNLNVCEKWEEYCISMHHGPDDADHRQHSAGFDGLWRKSQCGQIVVSLDSFVSIWNKVRIHEMYELKDCKRCKYFLLRRGKNERDDVNWWTVCNVKGINMNFEESFRISFYVTVTCRVKLLSEIKCSTV